MSREINSQFVPRITIEEYENQKREYTQAALRELQAQMKTIEPRESRSASDYTDSLTNSIVDSVEDNSSDNDVFNDTSKEYKTPKVNVIINNIKKNEETGLRKRKNINKDTEDTLLSSVIAQREIESLELAKFKNLARQLENALDKEESRNHYLKLDLNNALVDNTNLTIKVDALTKENTKLKDQDFKNKMTIIILKILLFLFVLHFLLSLIIY